MEPFYELKGRKQWSTNFTPYGVRDGVSKQQSSLIVYVKTVFRKP